MSFMAIVGRCGLPSCLVTRWRLLTIVGTVVPLGRRLISSAITWPMPPYWSSSCRPGYDLGPLLGSLVAAGVAAMIPQRVRAVILEDPPSPAFLANVNATPYGAIFRGMQSLATGYRGAVEDRQPSPLPPESQRQGRIGNSLPPFRWRMAAR
jgi:pimeloyl-ACP methyl ester carboxylesterase